MVQVDNLRDGDHAWRSARNKNKAGFDKKQEEAKKEGALLLDLHSCFTVIMRGRKRTANKLNRSIVFCGCVQPKRKMKRRRRLQSKTRELKALPYIWHQR